MSTPASVTSAVATALSDMPVLSIISSFLRRQTDLDLGFTVILITGLAPVLSLSLSFERHDALDLYHMIADMLYVEHEEQVFLYQQSMLAGANRDYEEGDWMDQNWVYEQMRMSGWDDSD